jgi:hypothetical protein
MKKTAMLNTVVWKKKELLAALSLSAHHQQKMMMNGTMLLISRLHTITNVVSTTQQSSCILHLSIGAVFFDVTHLVDLMSTPRLIRCGGSQLSIWRLGSKCHLAV